MSNEIRTPERSEYIFTQAPNDLFSFKLRAPREAYIALSSKPADTEPIYEIILGSSNNQKSILRKNLEVLVEVDTPDILNAHQLRSFWVSWKDNTISVGRENDNQSFISYAPEVGELFTVYYIGIRVGDDEHGTWILETERKGSGPGFWLSASKGSVPQFGVDGGYDSEKLYIARAKHADHLLPGYVVPSKGVCFVSCDGVEYTYANYEIFCKSDGHWVETVGREIPTNAVHGGKTEDGEILYLGRVEHDGKILLGKVQVTHECCYISYNGQELSFNKYEIFVWEPFGTMELLR